MKCFLLFCLALGVCASTRAASPGAGSDAAAGTAQAAGALVFEAERPDAVEGFLFSTVDIPFRVRNTGRRPVRILEITPRHGAGSGVAEPEVLAPGQSGRVILRRQVMQLGSRPHAFRVRTDDPAHVDYPLRARIFGMSAYTPDLPAIQFDVARRGRVTAQRTTITSYESARLELKSILEAPAWLEVRGVPRMDGESAQELVIEARVRADAPKGLLRGSVHLLTNVAAQPELVLPVQARVFDTVSATPMPATLKPAHPGDTRTVEVEYRSLDGRTLELDSISDTTGALKLRQRTCGPNCVKVTAEFTAGRVGEFGGVIKAAFKDRADELDVGWDILVAAPGTALRDLGTLGEEDGEATPVPATGAHR